MDTSKELPESEKKFGYAKIIEELKRKIEEHRFVGEEIEMLKAKRKFQIGPDKV